MGLSQTRGIVNTCDACSHTFTMGSKGWGCHRPGIVNTRDACSHTFTKGSKGWGGQTSACSYTCTRGTVFGDDLETIRFETVSA